MSQLECTGDDTWWLPDECWKRLTLSDTEMLECVQRRAAKLVKSLEHRSYKKQLRVI